ncbi:hypothetical protein K32_23930 [Kaistia sp. 32K]|uniref:phage baseplate assembly protein domain-containing protein n=1 Tax=Kaistia sp. 32K TaxID=2795690 RepID=UPI0019150CD2|nr:phage baseplate assembly protein [Kaistia sp. 32K]BCP53776.1 hypothetical protein K32_23930 [Kaistia sp. 32K]
MRRVTEAGGNLRGLLGSARGILKAISSRDGKKTMQHLDVSALAGELHEDVEHFEPYGFTSSANAGAEVLLLYLGANRSHPIVVQVADRRYRLQGLANGEVALHDDQGQTIVIKRDGIEITAPKFTVKSDDIHFIGASLKHNAKSIGDTHAHSGVTPGSGNTSAPV